MANRNNYRYNSQKKIEKLFYSTGQINNKVTDNLKL